MDRISKEIRDGKTIVCLDFSGLKEPEMILLLEQAKEAVATGDDLKFILGKFDERGFMTPTFMRRAEKLNKEYGHLIQDQAFVGLTEVKKFILKGFNLLLGKNYKAFNSMEDAIEYLMRERRSK